MKSRFSVLAVACLACVDLRPAGPGANPNPTPVDTAAPSIDADEFGVGWVVRDGVLESHVDRVRIQPGPGWSLVTDDVIARELPLAGVGLRHAGDEVTIALTFTADIGGAGLEDYRLLRFDELWSAQNLYQRSPTMTASFVDGHELTLESGLGDKSMEYVDGVRLIGDGALEVTAWYPKAGDGTRLRERVREGLATVGVLSSAEVDALRAGLQGRPDRQSAVGIEWSLRRGVYRDFVRDFTWTIPGNGWNVYTGDLATKIGPFVIVAQNRDAGLIAFLSITEDPALADLDGERWHGGLADVLGPDQFETIGPRRRLPLGAVDALVQRVVKVNNGQRFLLDYASIKHENFGMWWIVGGAEALVASDDSLVEAVVKNTRLEANLVEVQGQGDRVIDERWGYALDLPPGSIRADTTLYEYLEATSWRSDSTTIVLYAYDWSGIRREDLAMASITRAIRDDFPYFTFGDPRVSTIDIAGETARRQTWVDGDTYCDAVTVIRDRTLFQLTVVDERPQTIERIFAGFALRD